MDHDGKPSNRQSRLDFNRFRTRAVGMHIASNYLSKALESTIITIIAYLGRYNTNDTTRTEQSCIDYEYY
jgi:hypothetical protein